MSDETGLINFACTKNRFGERHSVTIRPDYEEGTFTVADSPQFTKRTAETETLRRIVTATPGLSQNSLWKQSGMMKKRFVKILKEGRGTDWIEEKDGNSLRYLPASISVLKSENNQENNRTGRGARGCSTVLSPLGENREQSPLDPKSCSRTDAQKQNSTTRTLPSCSSCGSYDLYRATSGKMFCQTCEKEVLVQ
jgi:hypothetical protein